MQHKAGYEKPWQRKQQSYIHGQQYGHQPHDQYAPQEQQHQQAMPRQRQQQQFSSSRPQQLPSYAQQQNGYRGQQQHQQPYNGRSSTTNPRPAKRMRADTSTPPPPQQQQQQQQQQAVQQQTPLPRQQQPQPPQQQQQQQQNAGSQQLPRSNNPNPSAAAWLDSLQEQIASFVERVVPTVQEQQHRDACLAAFSRMAVQSLPEHAQAMQVALFGSGAAGLSLHSSDLDVVLTGLAVPQSDTGGFDDAQKRFVVACLRRLERTCCWGPGRNQLGVQSSRLIARARVPVLKLQLDCGTELDVSLNGDGGVRAAHFLQSFQQDFAALRPLTLLLKCILKQRGLSEVYMGGLGSWSLVNMVVAHLMVMTDTGEQVDHLGSMLLSFLRRFGVEFDRQAEAVAVNRGGFAKKSSMGMDFGRNGILALEDPLTGREVAGGSHRYAEVEELFGKLHGRLQDALTQARQQQGGSHGTQAHQRFDRWRDDEDDDDYPDAGNRSPTYKARMRQQRSSANNAVDWSVLGLLLDCQEALQRQGGGGGDAADAAAAAGGLQRGGWEADLTRQQQGRDGGGQWRWGNGADRAGGAAAASTGMAGGLRKRERWER